MNLYILILIIIELGLSIFLIFEEKKEEKKKICNEDCNPVLTSEYNKFLGISNTILGIIFFTILLIIEIINFSQKYLTKSILLTGGSIFGLRLIYLQKYKIKHYCKYCMTISILTILTAILHFTLK